MTRKSGRALPDKRQLRVDTVHCGRDVIPSESYSLFVRPDMASGDLSSRSACEIRNQNPTQEIEMRW